MCSRRKVRITCAFPVLFSKQLWKVFISLLELQTVYQLTSLQGLLLFRFPALYNRLELSLKNIDGHPDQRFTIKVVIRAFNAFHMVTAYFSALKCAVILASCLALLPESASDGKMDELIFEDRRVNHLDYRV